MYKPQTSFDKKLCKLISDFDFVYKNNELHTKSIRGFTTSRKIGTFYSALSAIEHLIPLVKDDEFFSRYSNIVNQNNA